MVKVTRDLVTSGVVWRCNYINPNKHKGYISSKLEEN